MEYFKEASLLGRPIGPVELWEVYGNGECLRQGLSLIEHDPPVVAVPVGGADVPQFGLKPE